MRIIMENTVIAMLPNCPQKCGCGMLSHKGKGNQSFGRQSDHKTNLQLPLQLAAK